MSSTPTTTGTHHDTPARGVPRRLLWVLLAAAVVTNGICSLAGLPFVGSAFGVLALVFGGLLVRDHYRRRARTEIGHAPSGRPAA